MKNSKDHRIVEALIFGSTEPISEEEIKDKISKEIEVKKLLNELKLEYQSRGINLVKTGNNWSFRTAPDLFENLIILKKQNRKLSRAAIEVLSIIAYHQPITRAEIENIRGVQMGRGSIDKLLEIGWIKPQGRRKSPGRAITWVTTETFLDQFSLESLDDLPGLEELKASGFLDKRSALTTITDIADTDVNEFVDKSEIDEENIDDFIPSRD
tara:strand:- start:735 stop:1370 length:636 start_codon:yes stop_codon:yes gene_type:complete